MYDDEQTHARRKLKNTESGIPFVDGRVHAGFPSQPKNTSTAKSLVILIQPRLHFYGAREGSSMIDAGISDGDLLIVDKSPQPTSGMIAVCALDGEFTLKTIRINEDSITLEPANRDFPSIRVTKPTNII